MANCELSSERIEALRTEYTRRNVERKGKYPRQKMLPEYKTIYPWVIPDDNDPYFAFCTVCECRLRAKRTDLGKHEGSFKHTENSAKKGKLVLLTSTDTLYTTINKDDAYVPYIKNEPLVVQEENSNTAKEFKFNSEKSNEENESEDEEMESKEMDDNQDSSNLSDSTSSVFESISQHSIQTGYKPMKITDPNTAQCFSIREIPTLSNTLVHSSNICHYTNSSETSYSTKQPPCKITIKKITGPLQTATTTVTPTQATITAVPASITISQQPPTHSTATNIASSIISKSTSTRDPLELFFDSICASVKALPAKLATEGKIRVMKVIGELEIRAIEEREQINATGNSPKPFQQSSMVASTTK